MDREGEGRTRQVEGGTWNHDQAWPERQQEETGVEQMRCRGRRKHIQGKGWGRDSGKTKKWEERY